MAIRPEGFAHLWWLLRQPPPPVSGGAVGRWKLATLRDAVPALAGYGISGLRRLLQRAGIRLKRGRLRLQSPDPTYREKEAQITALLEQARQDPAALTLIYADEVSIYRQPTLAPTWAAIGHEPTAPRSLRANNYYRYGAGLNAVTGQVTWLGDWHLPAPRLCAWLDQLRQTYPQGRLVVVWDNWNVHTSDAVTTLAAQRQIDLVLLPTYAPWLNPIEKLWRWLKQEVTHCHRLADDWDALRAAIATFLERFAQPSPDLVRYTGLCPD
jgi:transposase